MTLKVTAPLEELTVGGSGYGAGAASAGFGAGWICVETGPPPSGAYDFARAIAMINYSKKLKSIKYDEFGGVIDYEFEQQPLSYVKTTPQEPKTKASNDGRHSAISPLNKEGGLYEQENHCRSCTSLLVSGVCRRSCSGSR